MVALASPARPAATVRGHELGWSVAAVGVLLLGVAMRFVLGGGGIGDLSAAVMAVVLASGAWMAARVLANPRAAFLVTIVCVALFDIAALPARNQVEYDDLQAFYRTDQVLSAQVPVIDQNAQALTLLTQPMFAGAQPTFGLAADVNGIALGWNCVFQHGVQRLALPLPPEVVRGVTTLDVQLRLTGLPSRESDYLLVYQSSRRGGVLLTLEQPPLHAVPCSLT